MEGIDVLELGTINLIEIPENTTLVFPITLPEGITNETGITEATVDIQFPNLKMATLSLDNIQMVGVPEGLEAELITQVLEVNLRGPAAQIRALTAEKMKVIVDLTNAQVGTDKYAVRFETEDAFSGVGAMSSYTVMVTLTEAKENR